MARRQRGSRGGNFRWYRAVEETAKSRLVLAAAVAVLLFIMLAWNGNVRRRSVEVLAETGRKTALAPDFQSNDVVPPAPGKGAGDSRPVDEDVLLPHLDERPVWKPPRGGWGNDIEPKEPHPDGADTRDPCPEKARKPIPSASSPDAQEQERPAKDETPRPSISVRRFMDRQFIKEFLQPKPVRETEGDRRELRRILKHKDRDGREDIPKP